MRHIRSLMLTGWIAAHVCAAYVTTESVAHAQTSERALVVYVEDGSDVDPAAVRRAIASELGARVPDPGEPTPQGAGIIHVHSQDGVVRVTFRDARGRTVERQIFAPSGAPHRVRMIALLAGNLARNEADDLAGAPAPTASDDPSRTAPPVSDDPWMASQPSAAGVQDAPMQQAPSATPSPNDRSTARYLGDGRGQITTSPAPARSDGSTQRTVGWVAIGSGAAGVVAGVVLRVMAASDENRAVASCSGSVTPGGTGGGGACLPAAAEPLSAANAKNVESNWALLLGGLAAATGIVLELTAPSASNSTTLAVGPQGLSVARTF